MKKQSIAEENVHVYPGVGVTGGRVLTRLCRNLFLAKVADISVGHLELHENGTIHHLGDRNDSRRAVVEILNPEFYVRALFGGTIGAGEAYMENMWRTSDLPGLIRLVIANSSLIDGMDEGIGRVTQPLNRLFHLRRSNTKHGSKKNISAHYDLGNDFYSLFLDPTMAYSAAIFTSPDLTLEQASQAKFARICQKLKLSPEDHLLEIGTGWGGFALFAARNYGCRITTVTISRRQFEYASRLIEEHDLTSLVTVLFRDYRDVTGSFDKIVSIEMLEAVGHQFYDTYFAACARLLKPDGLMLLQTITIRDQVYERYRRGVDFIRRYIFPGGCVPSLTALMSSMTRATDFNVFHLEDIGPHYATTLQHWRKAFLARLEEVRELGLSESFIRMWEFYLAYCEAGFSERYLGDLQLLLVKPQARLAPVLPDLGGD